MPVVLWVFLGAGSTLPSAPGYAAAFQLAPVWALAIYSVSPSVSVAIAVALQFITLLVVGIMAGSGLCELFQMNVQASQ